MKTSGAEIVANTGLWHRVRDRVGAYVLLIKPGIVLLVTITGLAAVVREGSLAAQPLRMAGVLLGIFLAAGAAHALNQFWDRDIDAIMLRTRSRRPLPSGRISPQGALSFALVSGGTGLLLLLAAGSGLAATLALGTMAFYIVVYTIWLKRRTPLNIVIGGAAGAAPPLIGWAAGAGELTMEPLLMFLVIFLWTPPHFWALALCTKEEYARAGIPMLPVVAGEKRTRARIAFYVALLLPATAALGFSAGLGWPFQAATALLGINLARKVVRLNRRQDPQAARELFGYSIIYLAAVFVLLVVPW
jgi:protoheme IX farnesyltransferase